MCRVLPVTTILSLPVPLVYRKWTIPLPAVAPVPSAAKSQNAGSVKTRCTPVIVPVVVPVVEVYDLALTFQGRWPDVRVKQPPLKLTAVTDPSPAPGSPWPDLNLPCSEELAQKIPKVPVVVSIRAGRFECPVTGPPGLTVQVVAAAAGPASRPSIRAPAAAAGRVRHARAAVTKDTKPGYDRARRRVNARGGDSGTPAI